MTAYEIETPCVRGCTIARRHVDDCEDPDTCRGCRPRKAEHGMLCRGCHSRLVDWLDHAPWQHRLLTIMSEPVTSPDYSAVTTARITDGLRLDPTAPFQGPYAHSLISADASEPIRIAAVSAAQDLADMLSEWVETVVADHEHALHGPVRYRTNNARENGTHGRYRWSDLAEDHVWVEPREHFTMGSSCTWLVAQVSRLESNPAIGDMYEELGSAMAQAHCLAPWREQVARLQGIECPECHAHALVRFGGDEFVTCQRCNAHIQPGRYAIWVRMLVERRKEPV